MSEQELDAAMQRIGASLMRAVRRELYIYPERTALRERRAAIARDSAASPHGTGRADGEAVSPFEPRYGQVLTANDPEPPPGTLVRDSGGMEWQRSEEGDPQGWEPPFCGGANESWTKIAGTYGPVIVVEWGDEICERHDVPMSDGVCSSCLADSAASGR